MFSAFHGHRGGVGEVSEEIQEVDTILAFSLEFTH